VASPFGLGHAAFLCLSVMIGGRLGPHLMTRYQMTPDDYRAKWGLPPDYPGVAPDYAESRRALAMKIGLGRRPAAARRKLGIAKV
jgi:predicted transcriptional regulator